MGSFTIITFLKNDDGIPNASHPCNFHQMDWDITYKHFDLQEVLGDNVEINKNIMQKDIFIDHIMACM